MHRFYLFSRDERGLEALQVVMVLAISAVCLVAIKVWWDVLSRYFNSLFEILLFQ